MHDQPSDRAARFSPLRLIARATAGMSQLAMAGLALLAMLVFVPLVGTVADWMVKHREGTTGGVRPFQWVDSNKLPPTCVGPACGMASLPLDAGQQVGGAGSAMVTARIIWPAPVLIDASPGTYLDVVGAIDGLHPLVQRPYDAPPTDDSDNDTHIRPLLLANEMHKDGRTRPIVVSTEGFVSGWVQDGDGAEQLTPWVRPALPEHNSHTQEAAIERGRQWRALHMRRVQFQPVPAVVEVDVLRAALLEPIPVGYVMAWDWQAGGVLDGGQSQLIPYRSAVGVVTHVQEMGQYLRMKVQIPRTSPYGSAHWLWHRLDGMPMGAPVLSNSVRAVFFKPGEMLGATPDWWQLERVFFKLPVVGVMRAPAAAFDPACAESADLSHACVWTMLHGVAVPVQVNVQALPGGDMAITERAVFAGKALRAADWAAMPREFRRDYGSPSAIGAKLSRTLLDPTTTRAVLAPQPWLKAGLPVSVAARAAGNTP
jgi:hypothetical protein